MYVLFPRFVDMIIALRNCLDDDGDKGKPYLPVYFNPRVNLLHESDYEKDKLQCVKFYLRRIANKGGLLGVGTNLKVTLDGPVNYKLVLYPCANFCGTCSVMAWFLIYMYHWFVPFLFSKYLCNFLACLTSVSLSRQAM